MTVDAKPTLAAWTPFERGTPNHAQVRAQLADTEYLQQLASDFGTDFDAVRRTLLDILNDEIWINSRYQVNVRHYRFIENPAAPDCIHLSIKRRDKEPVGTERYRDFMRIKDELAGPEYEAIELYPARSREIDTATQYHLWLIDDPTFRFPFGWDEGRAVLESSVADERGGGRQNPFEEHHTR